MGRLIDVVRYDLSATHSITVNRIATKEGHKISHRPRDCAELRSLICRLLMLINYSFLVKLSIEKAAGRGMAD